MKPTRLLICLTVILMAFTTETHAAGRKPLAKGIEQINPPSWWIGMKTELQIMLKGEGLGSCDVRIEDGRGVSVKQVHKAESPNYLFIDVEVEGDAQPGERTFVFTKGGESFEIQYDFAARREGSAQRESFGTKDAVYLLMPDRFSNGNPDNDNTSDTSEKVRKNDLWGRHGGDIQGIENKLDYIADLGFTAIWCNPLLEDNVPKESYHGYACTDYYRIDSRFGSNEQYKSLVAKAHSKGLKMIMDIVTNHCGTAHWWMRDLPFSDWVHQWPEYTHSNCAFSMQNDPYSSKIDRENMIGGWFDTSMADINLDNPFVLQYFKNWAVWWIEWADLDGFRVDTYPYNEKYPMAQWCAAVREEYPQFNIVGEVWSSNVPQVAYWQDDNPNKDGFDSNLPSIMDFCLYDAICGSVNVDKENWEEGISKVYTSMSNDFYYKDARNMMIFPGNHDTQRLGDLVGHNPAKVKMVMAMMATLRGYPQIYSGDELMLVSKDQKEPWAHGGLRVELPDDWASDPVKADLHSYVRKLFQWRKTSLAVQQGRTLHFLSRDNTYAYFRYTDSEAVFVFVNNNAEIRRIPWNNYAEITGSLKGSGRNVVTGEAFDSKHCSVPGKSAIIIEFKN